MEILINFPQNFYLDIFKLNKLKNEYNKIEYNKIVRVNRVRYAILLQYKKYDY